MTITHFDSPGALARECRKMVADGFRDRHFPEYSASWLGGENFEQAAAYAETGNDKYVSDAERLLEKIRTDLIEIPMPQWAPSIAGAFPMVPDFLAGHPENMRHRIFDTSDRAPVRIYVCTTSSGGVDADILKKRGTAILALVMALQPIRPVELYAFSILGSDHDGESVACTRIPTETLHLGIAANTLCGQGWARGLNYGWQMQGHHRANGGWPRPYKYGKPEARGYIDNLVRRMGGTDHNLHIPPTERRDEIVKDPVRWVNERLAEYAASDREAPAPESEGATGTKAEQQQKNTGREITARFPGKCRTCGAKFEKGARIIYRDNAAHCTTH